MKTLSAVVIGYGLRGKAYSQYAIDHPDEIKIAAVADATPSRLSYAKELHNIPDDMCFTDWRQLVDIPKLADFAIIATQDNFHFEPAMAMIEKGYDILLEKPMAPTARECKLIAEAAEKKGVKVIVCHVLRFTQLFCKVKSIIASGEIGDVVSIVHMENVGNVHQSHSYVRGNWGNEERSSPMLLAKSCHDTDIVQWLIGKPCKKVQSFGSLTHFVAANKPEGAPEFCYQGCPHADTCYYNAVKLYYDDKQKAWFRNACTNKINPTDEEVLNAIKTTNYGRCVYGCDNTVVDHQVVNMEFEGGVTVSFSMNAFNKGGRFMRVFGTKGEIYADMEGSIVEVYSFATKEKTLYDLDKIGFEITAGHGGGDTGIMIDLYKYFNGEEPSFSICDVRTSYLNHLIAFAAEESRHTDTVVDLAKFSDKV